MFRDPEFALALLPVVLISAAIVVHHMMSRR